MSFTEQLLKRNLIGSDLYGDAFCLEAMEKKNLLPGANFLCRRALPF